MRKIKFADYLDMIEETPYIGFYTSWRGLPSTHDAGTVLSFTNGTFLYFESNEVGSCDWKKHQQLLDEEFILMNELDKIERQFPFYYWED